MHHEESLSARRIGAATGYVLSYLVFTTILFLIFAFFREHSWPYLKVMALTAPIAVLGIAVRRLLK
ncbi:TPA: hypothetical protein HA295_02595 [Candidatus Woesearchaeota archaeon]|nr:hypothetical protein [Candidatus Woesearchaeota archaeon]HII65641.1 hypothetical protein [Candidatus Woesearchaeota archaeon]